MTLITPKIAVAMNVFFNKPGFVILWISTLFVLILSLTEISLAQVYISKEIRCSNYDSHDSVGSCVHASVITNLHHLHFHALANWVPRHYSGGITHFELNQNLRRWGLKTYATFSSSKAVLDYAHVHRLPAVISYHRDHSCLFLGWYVNPKTNQITHAYVMNPNHPSQTETPTYTQFMNNWRRNDGEAVVILP